jgi:hypothetical protein
MTPLKKTLPTTLTPSYLSEPQVQYLSRLIEEVRNGALLIPKFQREFIWKPEQRLELLRSVKEGIPIGSLLVWRTTQVELKTFDTLGGYVMPPPPQPTPGATRQYLLDGHQRLSTLFGALNPVRREATAPSQREPVIEVPPRYFYDLENQDFVLPKTWDLQFAELLGTPLLPTNILFDSIALLKFQRGLLDNALVERVDALSNVFRNYKIPIVPLVTDNLEDATKAFQRINSSGTAMSDFHMVAALTYKGEEFDLAALMDAEKEKLAEIGWDSLDEKYILATIRAHKGLPIASPNADATSKALRKNPELVKEASLNLRRAALFLKEDCGLLSPQLLPYSFQAVVLAEAFRETPEPSPAARSELAKWFWRTSYTAYFLGARDKEMNNALRETRKLAKGERLEGTGESQVRIEPLPSRHDFRNARSKAFLLRLADLSPLAYDGQAFDAKGCLASHGPRAAMQLLAPKESDLPGFSGPENRFLVQPEKTHAFRDYLMKGSGVPSAAILASHALDIDMIAVLRRGDYQQFLQMRRQRLLSIEAEFVKNLGLVYGPQQSSE